MKKILIVASILILTSSAVGQNTDVLIIEDYSNPKPYMYFDAESDKVNPIDKEKGLYISKAGKMEASLSFLKELSEHQNYLNEMSDMEFTVLRLKGKSDDFVRVSVDLGKGGYSVDTKSIQFLYDDQGNWRLNNYDVNNGASFISTGKTTVNPSPTANIIRIEHRKDTLRYYMNNQLVIQHILKYKERIDWHNCKVLSLNVTIALDKVVFKGYLTPEVKLQIAEDEKQRKDKEIAAKYATMGLPIKIKSKTHTFYAYPGWADIFPNQGKYSFLMSEYNGKNPAEIFNEGPNSWIKNESSLYSLNFIFYEYDSITIQNLKESFIVTAMNRTGWKKEKIIPLEEQITMEDGSKGLLLFYVCPDNKGMVGGNYFNCDLYIEGDNMKTFSYRIFIEGGNPDILPSDAVAWKDYFRKVLLSVRPN